MHIATRCRPWKLVWSMPIECGIPAIEPMMLHCTIMFIELSLVDVDLDFDRNHCSLTVSAVEGAKKDGAFKPFSVGGTNVETAASMP
eukprot:1267525-Prymnesium_polylepis.1